MIGSSCNHSQFIVTPSKAFLILRLIIRLSTLVLTHELMDEEERRTPSDSDYSSSTSELSSFALMISCRDATSRFHRSSISTQIHSNLVCVRISKRFIDGDSTAQLLLPQMPSARWSCHRRNEHGQMTERDSGFCSSTSEFPMSSLSRYFHRGSTRTRLCTVCLLGWQRRERERNGIVDIEF